MPQEGLTGPSSGGRYAQWSWRPLGRRISLRRRLAIGIVFAEAFWACINPAAAQNFSGVVFIGDSHTEDSPWASTFASFFRATAIPSDQGGTNFARSGAVVEGQLIPGMNVPSGHDQITQYLNSRGGRADPHALYSVWIGSNDLFSGGGMPGAALAANNLVGEIGRLQAAGARYIMVANVDTDLVVQPPTFSPADAAFFRQAMDLFNHTLYTGIGAAGLRVIPLDFSSVVHEISNQGAPFGITHTSPIAPACGAILGCTSAQLVSPDAEQTYLFRDLQGHYTRAVDQILADYAYSVVVAPSEISLLAENAVKVRTRFITTMQNQINASQDQRRGPSGVNAWVTGDVSQLEMNNFNHFPDASGTPGMVAAGVDFRLSREIIVGGVVSTSTQRSDFSTTGNFTEDEIAGSIYAGYRGGPWWGNAILTYGNLDFAENRDVPIGITLQGNKGTPSGSDWSLAIEGGYKFRQGWFTSGPVAGLAWQRVSVDGFTETGSFTSLAFGDQDRDSLISAVGYRATLDYGAWHPFAQVVWDHEFAHTDRNITAFLTTMAAPGYTLPAVVLGKDWGSASAGTTWNIGKNMTLLGAFTADFGQQDATNYGGQIGLIIAF